MSRYKSYLVFSKDSRKFLQFWAEKREILFSLKIFDRFQKYLQEISWPWILQKKPVNLTETRRRKLSKVCRPDQHRKSKLYNQYHSTVFILQDRCDVYWTEWLFNLPIIIFFFTLCYRPFSPKFGRSTSDRISSMSPAAQKLAHSRLGIRSSTDKALRASYTPSPSHRLPGSKTPISLTPSGTPKSSTPSVKGTPGSKRGVGDVQSLTDNLLQIPKRPKAADFFE